MYSTVQATVVTYKQLGKLRQAFLQIDYDYHGHEAAVYRNENKTLAII
jgi:hypothetical protein